MLTITSPVTAPATRNVLCGNDRMASPATPAAATSPVARMSNGEVASAPPASHSEAIPKYATQWLAPRSTVVGSVMDVVNSADSIQSRKGGEYWPSTTRGTSHQTIARVVSPAHHSANCRRRGPRPQVSSHQTASGNTAPAATAFTPPAVVTARADRAAQRAGLPRREPSTRGISTQGATAIGHTSTETAPRADWGRTAKA